MSKIDYNIPYNKDLDKLGLKHENYAGNYVPKNARQKKLKKQREKYGFDARETWGLNNVFVEWLYTRLKMYLRETKDIIDLEAYEFEVDGVKYTQLSAINFIIDTCEQYINMNQKTVPIDVVNDITDNMNKALRVWAEVLPAMWW